MIPVQGYAGARVAVLGLGRSGLSAARALRAGGAEPVCWDDGLEGRARATGEGFALADLAAPGALAGCAALIVSPGIPHLFPEPNPGRARGLGRRACPWTTTWACSSALWDARTGRCMDRPPRVVAVTGSNGKSTTCGADPSRPARSRAARANSRATSGGGCSTSTRRGTAAFVVLELSSYQTDLARALTPDVAVFTNLSPDHLARHGGFGGYLAAKRRLFTEGGPDRAVIGVDEDWGLIPGQCPGRGAGRRPGDPRRRLASAAGGAGVAGRHARGPVGWRSGAKGRAIADVRPRPAYPACRAPTTTRTPAPPGPPAGPWASGPRDDRGGACDSFPGLPHRSQRVAEIGGVVYVNDSKATNADAAAQGACGPFGRIRWIAGGLGKEGGIASLAPDLGGGASRPT